MLIFYVINFPIKFYLFILAEVKQLIKWSDGAIVKKEVDAQILDLLGPKTVEELEGKKIVQKIKVIRNF